MAKSTSLSEALASVLIDAGRIIKGFNSIDHLLGLDDNDDDDDESKSVLGRYEDVESSDDE